VTGAFLHIVENPFQPVDLSSAHIQCLERFTVLMYDVTSNLVSVNDARRELFCKKKRSLEKIPLTKVSIRLTHLYSFFLFIKKSTFTFHEVIH